MAYLVIFLALLFSPARSSEVCKEKGKDIARLAREFRELRLVGGHFSGGAWNDDTDRWGGKLHKVMTQLGELLGNPRYRKADICTLMGKPDKLVAKDGSEESLGHYASIGSPYTPSQRDAKEEHLVYRWRGYHDYLYFVSYDSVIREAKWYFALE